MESLTATLFPDDGENTYAIIDGASCEELLDKLDEFSPEHFCLYAGQIEADVAEVAPYLIALQADHPFTGWLLDNGFGKHWGVFVRSPAELRPLRKHFRGFLMVRDPAGKPLYFRFYDPRVLSVYLPTCSPAELATIFGPVSQYFMEDAQGGTLSFKFQAGNLTREASAKEGALR